MGRASSDKIPVPLIRNLNNIPALTWEGKVFGVSNVTIDTSIPGQINTYAATTPTFTFRNLGSKVMVPLIAKLSQVGVKADASLITCYVTTLETGQFTSGTALNVFNRNQNSGTQATVAAFHTSTLPAFTTGNQRVRYITTDFANVTTLNKTTQVFPYPGFTMVRPGGQLDIFTNSAATSSAPNWHFDIQWAELEG